MIRPTGIMTLHEAITALNGKATNSEICDWIQTKYPGKKANAIRCCIIAQSVNHPSRLHYNVSEKAAEQGSLLFRTGRGTVELYDQKKHGNWDVGSDGNSRYLTFNGERVKPDIEVEDEVLEVAELTAENLFSKEFSDALDEVKSKTIDGNKTAAHKNLSEETIEIYKKSFRELKAIIGAATKLIGPDEMSDISFGMGSWIISGAVFSHIWGSFLPQETTKVSKKLPQLFIGREQGRLKWGMCLSDKASVDQEFVNKFSECISSFESEVKELTNLGFELKNGEKTPNGIVDHSQRIIKQIDTVKGEVLGITPQGLVMELLTLFPLYAKIVADFRSERLFPIEIEKPAEDDVNLEAESSTSSTNQEFSCDPKKSYWVYAPGESAFLWKDCLSKGQMFIGWGEIGDLRKFDTREDLEQEYLKKFEPTQKPINNTLALLQFHKDIRKGDVVLVKVGLQKIIGIGTVTGDYEFVSAEGEYAHRRNVSWKTISPILLTEKLPLKTLTRPDDLGLIKKVLNQINNMEDQGSISLQAEIVNTEFATPFSIEETMKNIFLDDAAFNDMIAALKSKKNILLEGPPGVGKTYVAKKLASALMKENKSDRINFVQFHPSYSYEDFIQGYRPSENGFIRQDGCFFKFCEQARRDQRPHVFIIDEINRGNLSKIFGELLVLLEADKRQMEITLTYANGSEKFSIPQNVYIIGTMNTADRSLSTIDYALRRRFRFFKLAPQLESSKFQQHLESIGGSAFEIESLLRKLSMLNAEIRKDIRNLGAGFEIGHSYFCHKDPDLSFKEWVNAVLAHEIYPLLDEYWFDEPEKSESMLKMLKAS